MLLAESNPISIHVVPGSGMQDEASPSAPDVEEALTRLQSQFAANQLQLAGLRDVDVVVRGLEICARIDERLTEPRAVKGNRLVVVIGDRFAVSLLRVAPS